MGSRIDVGIAGADNDAVVTVEKQVAIQTVRPRLYRKEEGEQHGAMGNSGRGH